MCPGLSGTPFNMYNMKIKNNIYTGLLFLTALMPLASCSDDLNELPSQSRVDGNVVTDVKSAEALLNGVYYSFAQCGTDYYNVKSTRCSKLYEAVPADLAGTAVYYQGPYMFETHDMTTMTRYSQYLWQAFYKTVDAANAALKQIGESSDGMYTNDEKSQLLAQAHGMRALAYYNILRYFGYSWDVSSPYGVVLRAEPTMATSLPAKRVSVADSYDFIISDLDDCIAHAPAQISNYYFGKYAAEGVKARVLMMRGQDGDYAEALRLCEDVIANGGYSLDSYADIFHKNGLNSPEVIFGIQPKENQTDVYETYFYRGSAQYFPTDKLLALYDANNDPRKEQMYMGTPTRMFGIREDGSYYTYIATKYTICKHLDPATATVNGSTTTFQAGTLEESQYQLRLSEIYLLKAEAEARLGDLTTAKADLKAVETKAGITDFSSLDNANTFEEVMQVLFDEAVKNLSFECGLEHNYMLRFPSAITTAFNEYYADKATSVFPIPVSEFQYNTALTEKDQNPGFSAE